MLASPRLPDDPVDRSFALQLLSVTLRWSAASARAEADLLLQRCRHLRVRIRNLIDPPPPMSKA